MSETDISHLMCTSGSRFKGESLCEDGDQVDQVDGGGTPTLSLECRDLGVKELQHMLCVSGVDYDQMARLVENVLTRSQ